MTKSIKIPKTIHYCWFGNGEKSADIINYIEGWKRILPDYEIVEWNETNFDINSNQYTKEAYEAKKWAFVTDYVRLYVLYNYGGIYMDTDVEVLKPLDEFLTNDAFSGFEVRDNVPTGIMAACKGQEVIGDLLSFYDHHRFMLENGTFDLTTNVVTITNYFVKNGLKKNGKKQIINGFVIYPQVYFCPNTLSMIWGTPSEKSYTIHHFAGSWTEEDRKRGLKYRMGHYLSGVLRNILGTDRYSKLRGK